MSRSTVTTVSCLLMTSVSGWQDLPSKWNILAPTEVCGFCVLFILKIKHWPKIQDQILKKNKKTLRLQPTRGPQLLNLVNILKMNRTLCNIKNFNHSQTGPLMRLQTRRLPFQTFKETEWTKRVTFHLGAISERNPMAIWFENFSKSTKWKWYLPFLTLISLKALLVLRLRWTWICLAFTLEAMLTLKRDFFFPFFFSFFLKRNAPPALLKSLCFIMQFPYFMSHRCHLD